MRKLMKEYGWDAPFQPMNVKNAGVKSDKLFADDGYIAELKRDGSRYVCIDARFFSRKLSENKSSPDTLGLPVEKTANIPHLAEFFAQFGKSGIITDGEVYYPGGKSNTVTQVMGCDPQKALMRQGFGEFDHFPAADVHKETDMRLEVHWRLTEGDEWVKVDKGSLEFLQEDRGKIRYMVFDLLHLHGLPIIDLPWEDRRHMLDEWYEQYVVGTEWEQYIDISVPYEGENAKRALLEWAEANKEEGIVFKNRKSVYVPGKRPEHHWYRIKGKIYADVVVMGVEPPEKEHRGKTSELAKWSYWEDSNGHKFTASGSEEAYAYADAGGLSVRPISKNYYMGWIGSVVFGLYKDTTEVEGIMELVKAGTCSGMDERDREMFTERWEEFVAARDVIEVSAMERTDKGMFRHPQFERFREDKNAHDCLWATEMEDGADA